MNPAELSETLLDDESEVQSLASHLCVYDVEKLTDDADFMLMPVSKQCQSCF